MSSVLNVSVQGLEKLARRLQAEEENVVNAMTKAHAKAASEAVHKLNKGLANFGGRDREDPKYQNSPKGELPYAHSERLKKSIGMKVLPHGRTVSSEVGSGAEEKVQVEYAQYLEGENGHQAKRPFLWYVKDIYNAKKIIEYFHRYYKPLSGGKQ